VRITPASDEKGDRMSSTQENAEVASEELEALAANLGGALIRPGEAEYESACEIWNGMIDRRPALIVRPANAEDVAASVTFARGHDLPLAVRGGGHGVAGHALCDGGLMIDLRAMNGVEVDPDRRTARVAGGCTLGDADRETQRFGLATPLGVVTATGVAGLTLSGGMGWLRRKHGLSCDNLISAQVVTADGSILTASETENDDLFWAIRGGGGNFGVVTEFDYQLHPVGPEVAFCFVIYPEQNAREVLLGCDRYLAEAPEDVAPIGVLGHVPEADEIPADAHGEPMVALLALHPGDPSEGERVLRPLREIAEPIADLGGTMPYTEAQSALDEDYPDGWRYYWKSVNVPELSDELIERLVAHNAVAPSAHSTVDVWYQGGAMARVGEQETAFGNRSARYLVNPEANWEESGEDDANVAWVRDAVADLRSFSEGGIYLNFPGFLEEGEQLVREGYGANYERLAEIKARYDPENLFRLNANVEPAG
jgi:FAD/FMN-containing dehydrogenase